MKNLFLIIPALIVSHSAFACGTSEIQAYFRATERVHCSGLGDISSVFLAPSDTVDMQTPTLIVRNGAITCGNGRVFLLSVYREPSSCAVQTVRTTFTEAL